MLQLAQEWLLMIPRVEPTNADRLNDGADRAGPTAPDESP